MNVLIFIFLDFFSLKIIFISLFINLDVEIGFIDFDFFILVNK